jgi:cellulose synthase/poly-beta-1,6-N-acetylglucosamine synthase-like glycosyltransferase
MHTFSLGWWVLATLATLSAAYWMAQALLLRRSKRVTVDLRRHRVEGRTEWPRLSLVVPARNEAEGLEAAVRSRLADDYPNLEVVLVEDRSSDETPSIADRLAETDGRVKVVHIRELPDGWLGKLNALQRGLDAASGEWVLFSDADVHFEPGTLRAAVDHAETRGLDFVSAVPNFLRSSVVLDALVAPLARMIAMAAQPDWVEDASSRAAFGAGLFNLVRRQRLLAAGGMVPLRMELGDDVALGQHMKQSGANCSLVYAGSMISVRFYTSLRTMVLATDRASFPLFGRFSLVRLVLLSLLYGALELTPWCLLAVGSFWSALGAVLTMFALFTSAIAARWTGLPFRAGLGQPLVASLAVVLMWRSGLLARLRGGVFWRGTFYSTEALRAGAVLRLG